MLACHPDLDLESDNKGGRQRDRCHGLYTGGTIRRRVRGEEQGSGCQCSITGERLKGLPLPKTVSDLKVFSSLTHATGPILLDKES